MLMLERTIRHTYSHIIDDTVKMPRKNQVIYLSSPYIPCGLGIWWTDRKSPEGKRLYNVGRVIEGREFPPLFSD